jgi:hypothetical protein
MTFEVDLTVTLFTRIEFNVIVEIDPLIAVNYRSKNSEFVMTKLVPTLISSIPSEETLACWVKFMNFVLDI